LVGLEEVAMIHGKLTVHDANFLFFWVVFVFDVGILSVKVVKRQGLPTEMWRRNNVDVGAMVNTWCQGKFFHFGHYIAVSAPVV
jgi:hypothetical protein